MTGRSSIDTETRASSSRRQFSAAASRLLGESESICSLRSAIDTVAGRSATVLLEGETGVGKEVAAREIHALSSRSDRAFIPVDCTAFSSQLIESQLFGHVRGAFTGAVAAAMGFLRCADGGTLFLDEVGELPLSVQAKLLRCLQERTVVPVGGTEAIPVDLRVVAATHRDLAAMVRDGSFRQDLYFRLNVVRITIRPLRERREDVLPLARHFVEEVATSYEEPLKSLTAAAEATLLAHEWSGNVRELRNAMERAFLFCGDRSIDVAHLPSEIRESVRESADTATPERQLMDGESIPRLFSPRRGDVVKPGPLGPGKLILELSKPREGRHRIHAFCMDVAPRGARVWSPHPTGA